MSKWEDLCLRCGLCCHEKVLSEDYLIFLPESCQYYDEKSGLCMVYDRRFKKCRRCMKVTPFKAMFAPYLPSSCSYVQWAIRHHIRFCRNREVVFSFDEEDSV